MMIKAVKLLAVAVVAIGVGACEGQNAGTKQTLGTIIGAGAGALAGSQIGSGTGQLAAVAIGTLLGAYVGSEIGASLDKADKLYAERTAQSSLESSPSGTVSSWRNPDSGHGGTFTPYSAFADNEGTTCREFKQTIAVEGKTEEATGTACRQADGSWRIIKSGTAG